MAARTASLPRARVVRRGGRAPAPATRVPLRWLFAGAVLLLALAGGGVYLFYRSLDSLYPQELWKYFRPLPPTASGNVLYRTTEGQLLLAPMGSTDQAHRLMDTGTDTGISEYVRDATVLPGGRDVAYFATLRGGAGAAHIETDHVKVVGTGGGISRDVPLAPAPGEKLYPTLFASSSGRYVAVLSQDRARGYFVDLASGDVVTATPDAAPERMLWNRNGDLRSPALGGQRPYATSPNGKLRAQVREGTRRAPECDEPRCEAVQELTVSSASVAGAQRPPVVLFGAFGQFAADGWGPIPTQPAQRLYGRLVWSPDGTQILFSTVYETSTRTYAISVDGKTRPRLVLEDGEALDWIQ